MILQKIEIEQFGGLKHYVMELSGGAQYLYGVNEAGKSTLCAFIAAMFYGLPGKVRGGGLKGDSRSLFMPWGESYMAGTIYFEAEGQEFVLKRRFGKTAQGDRYSLFSAKDWQAVDIGKEEIGPRFLGVGADAFRKTLFISQLGAAFEKGKEDELMTRLSNLERAGDEDASVQKAISELEQAQYDLISKTGRGGLIIQLDSEIETLRTELLEAKQRNISFHSLLEEIRRQTVQLSSLEQTLAGLEKQRKAAAQFAEYEKRQEKRLEREELANRLEQERKALTAACEECQALNKEKESFASVLALEQDVILTLAEKEAACGVLEKRLTEKAMLEQELESFRQEVQLMEEVGRNQKGAWCFVLAFLVVMTAVMLGLILSPVFFVFALLAPLAFWNVKSGRQAKQDLLTLKARLAEKQAMLDKICEEALEEQLQALRAEMQAVFTKTETGGLPELTEKQEAGKKLLHRLEMIENETQRLLENVKVMEEAVRAMPEAVEEEPLDYSGPTLEVLEIQMEQLRREQMDCERLLAQQNAKAENGFYGTRGVSMIESELSDALERQQELRESYEAICLAKEKLEDCLEELKSSFAPVLNETSGRLIERLTGGRYQEVRVTDEYKLMLKTPSGTEIVPADYVSVGTYDLLYFALRLAVLHTLYDKIPLLILDDTFIQMDPIRQTAAFSLLKGIKAGQILYFSCHEAPKDWETDRLITLQHATA